MEKYGQIIQNITYLYKNCKSNYKTQFKVNKEGEKKKKTWYSLLSKNTCFSSVSLCLIVVQKLCGMWKMKTYSYGTIHEVCMYSSGCNRKWSIYYWKTEDNDLKCWFREAKE